LEDQLKDAARLDGLTCFITNMSNSELADQEVIAWYIQALLQVINELNSVLHYNLLPLTY
jgi:hypothetical protein